MTRPNMASAHATSSGAQLRIHGVLPWRRRVPAFWRHFLEMLLVMFAGMSVCGAVFVATTGVASFDEATTDYPTASLVVMALGMTVPMVAWMLFRRMGGRNAGEMAAAMVLPVIPFLCLVWFGATKSALCGVYCALAVVAMLALMLYRRAEYSMDMSRR